MRPFRAHRTTFGIFMKLQDIFFTSSDFPVLTIFYPLPLVHNFSSAYAKAVVSSEEKEFGHI